MRHRLPRSLFLSLSLLAATGLTPMALADYGGGVTLYEDKDFRGDNESFHDDVPYLKDTYFGQDRASSVRVPRGCAVTLFSDADFRGRSTTLNQDAYDLRNTQVGNDTVSSMRVRCRSQRGDRIDWGSRRGVALYSDADFDGRREIFYGDDRDLRNNRIGNDTVSSVAVAPGCRAILYSNTDFRGRSATVEYDAENLRSFGVGNDAVSSLRVECDRRGDSRFGRPGRVPDRHHDGVTLYVNSKYQGRSAIFYDDVPHLGDTIVGNDTVSSITVSSGCVAELFEHTEFRGASIVVRGDDPDLRGSPLGSDRASSMRVDCDRRGRFGRPGRGHRSPDPGPGGGSGVTLFRDNDYEGRYEVLYRSVRDLRDTPLGNDAVSSVQVAPGCRAVLYRESDFRGQSTIVIRDTPSLQFTAVGNDTVSSVEVDCRRR